MCSGASVAVAARKSQMRQYHAPVWIYFVAGGLGDATAACFSHPLDTLKVRQQLKGELSREAVPLGFRSLASSAKSIFSAEGAIGLYRGLSASVGRQIVFSGLRHGGLATACAGVLSLRNEKLEALHGDKSMPPHPSKHLKPHQVVCLAACVGASAAFIANPFDVSLIRMQADGHWKPAKRRNYKHVFDAIASIVRQEGAATLWRGCGPTVIRAALCTLTQLPTYLYAKELLLSSAPHWLFPNKSDDAKLHIISSLASAAAASLATAPVDVVKTRIINMNKKGGGHQYSSAIDCVMKILRYEGVRGMYKGLLPTFVRLAPHTVVLWTVQEACLRKLWEIEANDSNAR